MQAVAGVNKKAKVGYSSVYVGRGSPLGNPFPMQGESMRDEVCEKFIEYFNKQKEIKDSPVRKELVVLFRRMVAGEKLNLQCFCKPRRCHADTLAECLNKAYQTHISKNAN